MKNRKQKIDSYVNESLNQFNKEFKDISVKNEYPFIKLILMKAIKELQESVKKDSIYIYNQKEYNFFKSNS